MKRTFRTGAVLVLCFAGIASCKDPFNPDLNPTKPRTGGAGGEGTGGTGGKAGSGAGGSTAPGGTGSGGAGATGGSGGSGGAGVGGTGGNAGSGGRGGSVADSGVGQDARSGADAAVVMDAPGPDAPVIAPDVRPDRTPPPDSSPVLYTDAPPAVADPEAEATCPANLGELDSWFPLTPPVRYYKPLPHPQTECPFYVLSFQNYLIATQPDAQGKPEFLKWPTPENTFGANAGEPTPAIPFLGGGVTQAGGRQVLIDQKGHAIYYGVHFNRRFAEFVEKNKLQTAEGIKNADPNLVFGDDVVELKTAWQVVDDAAPPANFIVSKVQVPTLKVVGGQIAEDRTNLRTVTAALIAIHVVFTIPGHPEFIWSTFEHVDARGLSDIAPSAAAQPPQAAGAVISRTNHVLYRAGATAGTSNRGATAPMFDEATQTFAATAATSIYRIFPGSLSQQPDLDEDVISINENMRARYTRARLPANDRRGNYLMVGAIWLDKPEVTFGVNKVMVNDPNDPDIKLNGPESPRSITGGEDRLSSTAMESFTQGADAFPNCFSCHDTREATARGVPLERDMTAMPLMPPKKLGVSHVFNEVIRLGL